MSFRALQHRRCPGAEPCSSARLRQEHPWHAGAMLALGLLLRVLCPQNSAVPPTRAHGEGIGQGRHCLGLWVTSQGHLPAPCPGWHCHCSTGVPGAPAGVGTPELASKTWTVICLKKCHFLGLQTCKFQGNICLYLEHQILNSTLTKALKAVV